MELRDVIDEYLKEKALEDNWLEGNKTSYSKEYLQSQLEKMDKAYKKAIKLIDEYHELLSTIEGLIKNGNFKQVEKMYIKLNKAFGKIQQNNFFETFILPMNRVQYKMLADSIHRLNEERNPAEKGKRIVDSFRSFMNLCKRDLDGIEEVYKELKMSISGFINNN